MAKPDLNQFETRDLLAKALALAVSTRLADAIKRDGAAFLAVSGGSTPGLFFDVLSHAEIEWDKVTVTLVDERLAPDTSSRSNAALVKSRLLQNNAKAAHFLPLYTTGNIDADAATAERAIRAVGRALDVAILGMGNDGHTASFFPDAAELATALDKNGRQNVCAIHAQSAGEPRLTLTLPPLLEAGFLALHIEGAEKKATLERILAPGAHEPIRRVLDATQTPAEIFWAP